MDVNDTLKDIRGFENIGDFSLYLFLGIAIIAIIFIIFIIIFFLKRFKNTKENKVYQAKEKLDQVDFSNSKNAAYTISKYAPFLISSQYHQELYDALELSLQKYKYKKEVPSMKDEDIKQFKSFLEICNV